MGMKILILLSVVMATASSQLIIPKPTLDVEFASSYSIAINWTMPLNELFDGFRVTIQPEGGLEVEEDSLLNLRRQFDNLIPGVLYTFVVQARRGDRYSEPVVILQDTVPLPPTDLQLEYFDKLVLTLEGPYFQDTAFTVDMPGIEATWQDPKHGVCECYLAVLTPDDGYQAIPGENDEVVVGTRTRQFIHLVPGKTYTVKVHSSTCGEGHLGALRSDPIEADFSLPPADPPAIVVEDITPTTARLSWANPPINGLYDDFEVIAIEEPRVVIEEASDRTEPRRNISNLSPCKPYEFEVYTLYQGRRSMKSQKAILFTTPFPPQSVISTEFTESSISLQWESSKRKMIYFEGFQIEYSSPKINKEYTPILTKDKSQVLTDLEPGTTYSISVTSVCQNERRLLSVPVTIQQTTKPEAPRFSRHGCSLINPPAPEGSRKSIVGDAYQGVPWDAPNPSLMTLSWSKPNRGLWDGFVIDYSPFEFEQGVASPAAPVILGPNQFTLDVEIPVSGYVMSVTVRSISNGVLSEPLLTSVQCGDEDGESKRRCKASLMFWNITITPNENGTLSISIPDYPFYNATVFANGPIPQTSIYNVHNFTIPNPCQSNNKYLGSTITVYPICPPELPFCPIITRKLCAYLNPKRDEIEREEQDACCNSRFYNSKEAVCCHGKLLLKSKMTGYEECCISRWYSRNSQQCCPPGRTSGSSGLVLPGRVTCPAA